MVFIGALLVLVACSGVAAMGHDGAIPFDAPLGTAPAESWFSSFFSSSSSAATPSQVITASHSSQAPSSVHRASQFTPSSFSRSSKHSSSEGEKRTLIFDDPAKALPGITTLLDLDVGGDGTNGTFIQEGVMTRISTFNRDFTFDPAKEFLVIYVNVSIDVARLSLKFADDGGKQLIPTMSSIPTDTKYLGTAAPLYPFQSITVAPKSFMPLCRLIYPSGTTACKIHVELNPVTQNIADTPYHLGVAHRFILPWGGEVPLAGAMPAGTVQTWAVEITEDDLPVALAMEPEQSTDRSVPNPTDHMLYLFNAINPQQYFAPSSDYRRDRERGAQVDWFILSTYSANQHPDGPDRVDPTGTTPGEGGTLYADPNYGAAAFSPGVYLLTVFATRDSKPTTGTLNRYQIYAARNFVDLQSQSWNSSTYGIVGALTLLILCLISCAVAFLRRRCRGGARDDGGGFFGNGPQALTRAQRDELPAYDADGRPIRYDPYGRVLPDLGAKKEQIEALPEKAYTTGLLPTEDAHCTICLGEYETGEKLKQLPCGHNFHSSCIAKWLQHKSTCPTCVQDIAAAKDVRRESARSPPPNGLVDVPLSSPEAAPLVQRPESPAGALQPHLGAWCIDDDGKEQSTGSRRVLAHQTISLGELPSRTQQEGKEREEGDQLSSRTPRSTVSRPTTSPSSGRTPVTVHVAASRHQT